MSGVGTVEHDLDDVVLDALLVPAEHERILWVYQIAGRCRGEAGYFARTTLAYTGQYEVISDKLIEQVELSSTYALVGASQKYYIGWSGDKLTLESTPLKDVNYGIAEITTFVFERSQ